MAHFESATINPPVSPNSIKLADLHQECVICFEELYKRPVCHLVDDSGNAICKHLYHNDCIGGWFDHDDRCPVCRVEFADFEQIPDLSVDPQAWFDCIDVDKDGNLSYSEIIEGLKSQLPLDWGKIESDVDRLWIHWDKDRNGTISYEEFADKNSGVLAYLLKTYPKNPRPEPPNLIENYHTWFEYWDEDNSGSLDKSEITRALIKTFRMYDMSASDIKAIVDAIWPIFDEDGSGVIEKDEFCAPNNLAEALSAQIANEAHQMEQEL
jgi:Ca2+-binding EF-hand superfamily protein